MTEQKKRIIESVNYLKDFVAVKNNIKTAVITYKNPYFLKSFRIIKRISFNKIPPVFQTDGFQNDGELLIAKSKLSSETVFIMNGRFDYFNGYDMRDIVHPVYVFKMLGVKNLILIDETGFLNPRYELGNFSLIYDHINLMGNNPLIGENDNTLGPRFPDMSNAYDSKIFYIISRLFINKAIKFYSSVYLGITGPETETEAECRFYREIGADILGYSIVPENLAAVHCGLNCIAFGMLSRELVADRLEETPEDIKLKNRLLSEKYFSKIILDVINIL
jgi:purine-nucleoside phosphorylase